MRLAQIIDFQNPDNNDLLVVNQFSVAGTKQARRPDVVVFVNGLPLAVVELKNPADESADVWKAYSQLQTYKDEISDLLTYNVALVISDGITARVGSLTANKERFMPWETIKNEEIGRCWNTSWRKSFAASSILSCFWITCGTSSYLKTMATR